MDLVAGNLYWTSLTKIPNKYTYVGDDMECDVVIIGGGITGAICGYFFAESGIDTILVEKNIIGYGSTSASTSILQYEIDRNMSGLKNQIGMENAVKAFRLCEKAVYDIEKMIRRIGDQCGFRLCESLYFTSSENEAKFLRQEYELRKENGFNVEFLDEKEGKERYSLPIKAGIYSKSGVGEIDPYRFSHGLLSSASQKGLKIFENTEIINMEPQGNTIVLTTNNHFRIKAKKAIIASGFESRTFIKKKVTTLTRTFTIVTKPVKHFDGWYRKSIIRNHKNPYTYLRTTMDNRIIIGGEDIPLGGQRSKMAHLTNDAPAAQQKYEILMNRLREWFPQIGDIQEAYKFSGIFGGSKDSLPYIGEYEELPNCYFCLGYGSNGILYAVMGAQILRELYLDHYSLDAHLFSFYRK
ncbi:MAG: NAD(P)/FAD-dependent oxidoreductase [Bacillota bacterium]